MQPVQTFGDVGSVEEEGRELRGVRVVGFRTCDGSDVADLFVVEVVTKKRRLQLLSLDNSIAIVNLHA